MKKIIIIFICLIGFFAVFQYFLRVQRRSLDDKTLAGDVVVVGTNAEYSPFSFIEKDTIVGFDIDLIKEICKRLNKKVEIKDMPFDVLIPEMQRGSVQIIAAGMTPTPDRAKEVLFTRCYFTGDPLVIVAPVSNSLTTIDQLKNKKVVVNEGYTADYYMSDIKGPELIRLPTPAAAFLALQVKRAAAYVAARSTVSSFFNQYGTENFTTTPIPNTEEKYALVVSPHSSIGVAELNKLIDAIKDDGTLDKLKKKWGLE